MYPRVNYSTAMLVGFPSTNLLLQVSVHPWLCPLAIRWIRKKPHCKDLYTKSANNFIPGWWFACHGNVSGKCIIIAPFSRFVVSKSCYEKQKWMLRKATKVHVYLQCFSLSLSKPERTSWSLRPQLDTVIIQVSSVRELNLRGNPLGLYRASWEGGVWARD